MKVRLQQVISEETIGSGCTLFLLREDDRGLLEGGNKYFKLKYNLKEAVEKGFDTILSFGGAYSNHIAALAAAGKRTGLKTIGVIRSDENVQSPTIIEAIRNGMLIHYVTREEYRIKETNEFLQGLDEKFGPFFLIPEGGSNLQGIAGCKEIVNDIETDYDLLAVPAGTGATAAGILSSLREDKQLLVFQVLKGKGYIEGKILQYLDLKNTPKALQVIDDFHFNGYARVTNDLLHFIRMFYQRTGIPLDHVYNGKMMYGLFEMMNDGRLRDQRIIAIHTGGIQGSSFYRDPVNKAV